MSHARCPDARFLEALSVEALLEAWSRGNPGALPELVSRLYSELLRRAEQILARQPAAGRAPAGALVHELYLALAEKQGLEWRDVDHFLAIAYTEMQRHLIVESRRKRAAKRGFGQRHVAISTAVDHAAAPDRLSSRLTLERALARLEILDPDATRVVRERFFLGFSMPEIARRIGVTERTIYRRWAFARDWLRREVGRNAEGGCAKASADYASVSFRAERERSSW